MQTLKLSLTSCLLFREWLTVCDLKKKKRMVSGKFNVFYCKGPYIKYVGERAGKFLWGS